MQFAGLDKSLSAALKMWIDMSRRKHSWPDEAEGNPQAYGALSLEVRELQHAIDRQHPQEHVISELLDVITVAMRMLNGEHLIEKQRESWLETLKAARPTQPGEVGPWDEHKGPRT